MKRDQTRRSSFATRLLCSLAMTGWLMIPVAARAAPTVITEFFNSTLRHYVLITSPAEVAAIEAGAAGPGWQKTGNVIYAHTEAGDAPGLVPVCRFYGSITPGPNSHFYTVDADECAALKAIQAATPDGQPRWNYEGIAFYIGGVVGPTSTPAFKYCGGLRFPAQSLMVNRYYNKRAAQGDSNHRYTITNTIGNQMAVSGWATEGLVMCAMQ